MGRFFYSLSDHRRKRLLQRHFFESSIIVDDLMNTQHIMEKRSTMLVFVIIFIFIFFFKSSYTNTLQVNAQTSSFRFGVWADTKDGVSTLAGISGTMASKSPKFIFSPGDLCSSGPTTGCLATWKTAYNNGGNLLGMSFVSRGNHDSGGTAVWTAYPDFNFSAHASAIGATNFRGDNLTYSFDYGSSHFTVVDMPGGDATSMSSSQIAWVDSDLTAAEARGIAWSFLFWHGPEYPMGGHCCTNATSLAQMVGRHQSVGATFHGHEHNLAYTHIDSTKIAGVSHAYEEFTIGGAGAGLYGCQRGDWCSSNYGLATIDVTSTSFAVNIYYGGTTKTFNFTKSGLTPTPVPTPSPTPIKTPSPTPVPTPTATSGTTPRPTVSPSPVPTNSATPTIKPTISPTLSPTPTPAVSPQNGDANNDKKIDSLDFQIILAHYNQATSRGALDGDFNQDGRVDGNDYVIWLIHFGL